MTTGISAYDRAHTIRTAVAPNAIADHIVQPGHIFPVMAQPGGVLTRAGHTEAGCDIARLAGLEPTAVIVEILNEDGSMARRPDLEVFARQHSLKMGTIEDLIRYRIEHEKTVHRVAECPFSTDFGEFRLYAYEEITGKGEHLALVKGEVDKGAPILVRVHLENTLCDVLLSNSKQCGWPLRDVMSRIAKEGNGVIVLLRIPCNAGVLTNQIKCLTFRPNWKDKGQDKSPPDRRSLGIGAQILADLSVGKMRLLSAPQRFHGLRGFGLEVVEYITE